MKIHEIPHYNPTKSHWITYISMIFPSDFRISPPLTPRLHTPGHPPASARTPRCPLPRCSWAWPLSARPLRAKAPPDASRVRFRVEKLGISQGKSGNFPRALGKKWEVPKGFERGKSVGISIGFWGETMVNSIGFSGGKTILGEKMPSSKGFLSKNWWKMKF